MLDTNKYPYTDFHELNLDWIIEKIKELSKTIETFVSIQEIKYSDPIQWDITKQYEKNTIVTNNNIAYISKVPIPSGIDIGNDNYWLLVADFSAQITEEKRERIESDEAINIRIDEEIENRQLGESAIDNKINIGDANAMILIGDSYGGSPVPSESWIHYCEEALKDSEENVFSNYRGGAAFGNDGFLNCLKELEGNVGEPLRIKNIIILGGANDYEYYSSTTNEGISKVSEYVATTYPNAIIQIGYIALYDNHFAVYNEGIFDHWDDTDKESSMITGVLSAYKKSALNFKNVSFIEDSEYLLRNYYYLREDRQTESGVVVPGDGLHPSANGSREIARGILGFIKTGTCIQENHYSVGSTFVHSGSNTAGDLVMFETQCKEYLNLYGTAFPTINNANFSTGEVELFNCYDDIKLPRYLRGLAGSFATIPCEYRIVDSTGAYAVRTGKLIFKMGKVYISSFYNENVNGVITISVNANLPILYC